MRRESLMYSFEIVATWRDALDESHVSWSKAMSCAISETRNRMLGELGSLMIRLQVEHIMPMRLVGVWHHYTCEDYVHMDVIYESVYPIESVPQGIRGSSRIH